jgi:hypothetical protein
LLISLKQRNEQGVYFLFFFFLLRAQLSKATPGISDFEAEAVLDAAAKYRLCPQIVASVSKLSGVGGWICVRTRQRTFETDLTGYNVLEYKFIVYLFLGHV